MSVVAATVAPMIAQEVGKAAGSGGTSMLTGLGAAGLTAATQGAGALIASMSPAARALRQQRQKDIKALQSNKLGFSDAQKQQMLRMAAQGSAAQQAQQSADVRRMQAAQGFGRSGLLQQQAAQPGQTAAQALTAATGQVEDASTRQALAEKKRIIGDLAAQRAKVQKDYTDALSGAYETGARARLDAMDKETEEGALMTAKAEQDRQAKERKAEEARRAKTANDYSGQ